MFSIKNIKSDIFKQNFCSIVLKKESVDYSENNQNVEVIISFFVNKEKFNKDYKCEIFLTKNQSLQNIRKNNKKRHFGNFNPNKRKQIIKKALTFQNTGKKNRIISLAREEKFCVFSETLSSYLVENDYDDMPFFEYTEVKSKSSEKNKIQDSEQDTSRLNVSKILKNNQKNGITLLNSINKKFFIKDNSYDNNYKESNDAIMLEERIKNIPKENFKLIKKYPDKRYRKISIPLVLNENILEKISSNSKIYFNIRLLNKNDILVDYISKKYDIKNSMFINRLHFEKPTVSGNRTAKEVTIDFEKKSNNNLTATIYAKTINDKNYFKINNYQKLTSVLIKNKKHSLKIINSKTKKKTQEEFAPFEYLDSDHLVIRIIYSIQGVTLNNFNELCFKKISSDLTQELDIPFYVKKQNDTDFFEISINRKNIPPNIVFLTLIKRKILKGVNNNNKFKPVINKDNEKIISVDMSNFNSLSENNEESVILIDNNIKDLDCYEYKIKAMTNEGTHIISSNNFIVKYHKRDNLLTAQQTNYNTRNNYQFKIEITENNIEKLFNQLKGNKFKVFENDFAEIKKSLGSNIDFSVNKYEIDNSNSYFVGNFPIIESEKGFFLNIRDPYGDSNSKCFYKVSPRFKSLFEDITENATDLLDFSSSERKKIDNTLNQRYQNSVTKKENNVMSYIGNKYTKINARYKSTFSAYEDSKIVSGDEFYFTSNPIGKTHRNNIDFSIDKFSINYSKVYIKKNRQDDLFLISMKGSFKNIDHCLIFYKKNGEPLTLSSHVHIDDDSDICSFVCKIKNSYKKRYDEINFYVVAINNNQIRNLVHAGKKRIYYYE